MDPGSIYPMKFAYLSDSYPHRIWTQGSIFQRKNGTQGPFFMGMENGFLGV